MKKILSIKFLVIILLAGFLSGCEDFLNQVPKLSQSDELTLSTFAGLESATVGAYNDLCGGNWYGAGFIITADLKGGNGKRGSANSGRYVPEYIWNNSKSATSNLWTNAYRTVARANNVINKIDGGFSEQGVTEAQLDQLKGECLFLRALSFFDMLRLYAQPYAAGTDNMGIPIVLVTENGYPSRNTVGESYDQVVTDLEDAIELLAAVNPRGGDKAWTDSWAAKALLAKVHLYMENWQEAATYADEVIGNPNFDFFTEEEYTKWSASNPDGFWGGNGTGSEVIYQVDGKAGNSQAPYWEAISYMTNPLGYGDIATSQDLLGLYEAGDVRLDLFLEPVEYPGEFWTLKYPGRLGATPTREFNVPVLRISEMYLIRAEALLHSATITGETALDDYNDLRNARGLADAAAVTLADIYAERRRELCFEGNELFDLARTQRSLNRTDYSGASNEDITFIVGGTPLQNYLWAMPIPQAEADANVNLVPNPGY